MLDDYDLKQDNQAITLFRFELNQAQGIIILLFALIGLFLIPPFLGGEIFGNLIQSLFIDYLYYQLVPTIANIILYSFFFILSFITVWRLIPGLRGEGAQKSNSIPQDRIVKWFGLKLSHGQAIFIFSLSIMGIPFLIIRILGINLDPFMDFYNHLLFIPVGNYSFYYNEVLLNSAPFILDGLFFIVCLYSVIATRRGKKSPANQVRTASNLGVFIFIISFVILILYLLRLIAHLFVIFTDIPILFELYPQTKNIFQLNDFINVIIILIGSSSFLSFSYFLKKREKNIKIEKGDPTWFHIKLTKNRYIMLLSYAIMYLCVLSFIFLVDFFTRGTSVLQVDSIISYLIPFLLISYSLFKIRNKDVFQRILTQFNDSEDFNAYWFKFRLNRLLSVTLGSISSGAMFLYLFGILSNRYSFQLGLISLDMLWVIQLIFMLAFESLLLLFALYTIKCTYKGVKSP